MQKFGNSIGLLKLNFLATTKTVTSCYICSRRSYKVQSYRILLKQNYRSSKTEKVFFLTAKIFCFWLDTDYCSCSWYAWSQVSTLDKSPFKFEVNITKAFCIAFSIILSRPFFQKYICRLQNDTWKRNYIMVIVSVKYSILLKNLCNILCPEKKCLSSTSLSQTLSPCSL